jgi:uncharacterized protein YuzE
MKDRYLEVTYREGRLIAAYLYLPRRADVRSARTEEVAPGLLADYDAAGVVIGLEITAPHQVTAEQINAALDQLGVPRISPEEIAPLRAA